ncbi:MAG: response regulator [Myxococcales bacterium]|nr:response regulator [Myxococcales bacterium]
MSHVVMIVDDSRMIRMQVCRALQGQGFRTVEAADGQDAWEKLTRGEPIDVMVCDVNMPRMNGIELLEKLRSPGGFEDLPVVMLTTEGDPDIVRRARSLGAKGWLVKPFQAELLVATVQRMIGVVVS